MAMTADEDYALALRLQEEFDRENESVSNVNVGVWDEWLTSRVASESLSTQPPVPSSLIDSSWELIDPNPDARALFLEFNNKFFWGRLAGVEVRWSPRMTLCAGVCVYEGRGGMCSIRLSEPLLKLRPRKDLVETLLHEMIHAYLFVTNNDRDHDGHGPEFLKHMLRLNKVTGAHITVYHDFHDEVDSYRTHWWRCSGPCQTRKPFFGYVKRAMNRPPSNRDPWWSDHQRTCGGTFIKIKEPEDYRAKKNKQAQQGKMEISEKTNNKDLTNWLQKTSTQHNSSSIGQSSESVAKGSLTNGNTKTPSAAAAGTPDVIDVDFISDSELLVAMDELECNGYLQNVPGKTKFISATCNGNADLPDAGEVLSEPSTRSKLPESFSDKLEFPGKGIVLGQKSSQPPISSSSGLVLRRLPGIGVVEVRAAVPEDKVSDAREPAIQTTSNVESDKLVFLSRTESQKLSLNDRSCTVEDRSELNGFLSEGTKQHTNVDNQKPFNASTNLRKQVQKSCDTGFRKIKTDVRFWLSDTSREVGEVVRVPNFTSVGNPRFHKVKEKLEKALPSLKIPRQREDDHELRPAKKIRTDTELDSEMAPVAKYSTETKRTLNGACDKVMNVDNSKGKNVDNSRRTIVDNSRGMTVNKSKAVNVDNGRTSNTDKSRTNVGNNRTDSLDRCSVADVDCVMLCSDNSDIDESQTIASVINRIKASFDNVASIRQGAGSYLEETASIEPLQVADTFSSSVISANSAIHTDSSLPNQAPCPVCGLLVDVATINEHLDLCIS